MRVLAIMSIIIAMTAGSSAFAQQKSDQSKGLAGSNQIEGQPTEGKQAPIGHRQPTAKDVSPDVVEGTITRTPADKALDQKLKICRGC